MNAQFFSLVAIMFVIVLLPNQLTAQTTSGKADSELARLPFHRHMNLVIVKARINDSQPVNLLIDSGAGSSMVLDSAVAERLDLKMSAPRKGGKTSQGGQFTMRFAPRVSCEIGGHTVELTNVLVASCQGHAQTMLGIEVHGIIGHQFLSRVTLEVDYEAKELVLHDPKKYKYEGGGAILDLEFDSNISNLPFTTAVFESKDGKEHKVRMLIDSGGSTMGTGGLGLKKDIQAVVPADAPRVPAMGVSGLADTSEETMHSSFVTRLYRMRLGPFVLERPVISCGPTHNFNLFGAEVLRRFDVVFDYKRKRMILEPNSSFKDPIRQDTSGMMLIASEKDVNVRRIQFVTPASPAADAGLKKGDVLIKIDGAPADSQGLHATRELFFTAGETHSLEVKRGAEVLSVVLRTRDLFRRN